MKKQILLLLCSLLTAFYSHAQSISVVASATTICDGVSVTLTATAANAPNPTYQWTKNSTIIPGATSATLTTNLLVNSDTIRCRLTSGGNTVVSNAVIMLVNPLPNVNITATGRTTFCDGGSVVLSVVAGAALYQWYKDGVAIPGATLPSYTATVSGNFTVAVTLLNGCSKTSAPKTVTVNPLPSAILSVTGQNPFCKGSLVVLNAAPVDASNTYRWRRGSIVLTNTSVGQYAVGIEGTYTVAVTDSNGCTGISPGLALSVKVPPVFSLTANASTTLCAGASVTLFPNSNANLAGFTNYQWLHDGVIIPGATSLNHVTAVAGNYALSVSDSFGCSGISIARPVVVNPLPTPTLSTNSPNPFCAGATVVLKVSPHVAGNVYGWILGTTTLSAAGAQLATKVAGSYRVRVKDINGCVGTSPILTLTTRTPPAFNLTANRSTTFCTGDSVTLFPNAKANLFAYSYQWYKYGIAISGATALSYTAHTTGAYALTIADSIGCARTAPARVVLENPLPAAAISITGTNPFCTGGSVLLHASPSSAGNTYKWMLGATVLPTASAQYNATAAGNYRVTVTNANGCAGTSVALSLSTLSTVAPQATITALGSTTIGAGGSVTLQANAGTGLAYQWYRNNVAINGATGRNVVANIGGSFTVMVSNGVCDKMSAAVVVTQTGAKEAPGVTAGGQDVAALEEAFAISAFPNPADDRVTIRIRGTVSQSATVQAMTLTGAAVKEVEMHDAQTEIDLSGMASGIYLLRYKDQEGRTGIIRLQKQ